MTSTFDIKYRDLSESISHDIFLNLLQQLFESLCLTIHGKRFTKHWGAEQRLVDAKFTTIFAGTTFRRTFIPNFMQICLIDCM